MLCTSHHQRLCRSQVRSQRQEFELGDHLDNLRFHLDWCLAEDKSQVFHRCHRQHRTCLVIHRCHRRYRMNPESHHYRCLDR